MKENRNEEFNHGYQYYNPCIQCGRLFNIEFGIREEKHRTVAGGSVFDRRRFY